MPKKKVDNKKIIIIVGIAILVIVLLASHPKESPVPNIGFHVNYYNNGVEVFPEDSLFSTITPGGKSGTVYNSISFTISGKNTGNVDLNISIVNATPLAFKNALPTTTQMLSKGQTNDLWTSASIPTAQFETMPQPVRFWINVSGQNNSGKKTYSQAYIDLIITAKPLVKLRFDYLNSPANAAFSLACNGSLLNKYHYISSTNCIGLYTGLECPDSRYTGPEYVLLSNKSQILNPPKWAYNYSCIYQNTSSSNSIAVVWRVSGNGGQSCTLQNAWQAYVYNRDDSAAINNSPFSINSSTEVYCP